MRFSEVQLGDLGGCCHVDSEWARSGTVVGASTWSIPEILMEMRSSTTTDMWSFGALVRNHLSRVYGDILILYE